MAPSGVFESLTSAGPFFSRRGWRKMAIAIAIAIAIELHVYPAAIDDVRGE